MNISLVSMQKSVGASSTEFKPEVDPLTTVKENVAQPNQNMTYAQLSHINKHKLNPHEQAIVQAVEKANKLIMGEPRKFEYSVNKSFGDIVVKVVNAETNQVIKEIPPSKVLDIVGNIGKVNGVLIDEKR